jgi:hypothetical protein
VVPFGFGCCAAQAKWGHVLALAQDQVASVRIKETLCTFLDQNHYIYNETKPQSFLCFVAAIFLAHFFWFFQFHEFRR